MDTARWQQISELLAQALELAPSEREGFLATRTSGNGELLREVRALLAVERDSTGFLEPLPAGDLSRLAQAEDELLGERVGPYLLERELGVGGMGRVFLARRADGAFDQRVALKLVKRGMDTDRILERFRHERQVLAELEHPGIARLVDGGAAPDGRPYLAMEFVEGERIDRWCAARGLGRRRRIELFLEVCAAVQHAHGRLVVHRDLKPANVLVGADGRPRLLDFGLAKVLAPDGRADTYDVTAEGQRLMTPHYASPEQIRGERVTVATDVYALGVVLHELLTGRRPFELEGIPWAEVERRVCEQDLDPTGLPADLHTIVASALRKEPERRYASVEALTADLRRYLEGLPIAARPATVSYRVTKFVRRNSLLVGAVAAILAVLVGAIFAVARQARIAGDRADEAQEALARAREALDNAEAVNGFMDSVLLAASPRRLGRDVTVREAVTAAADGVDATIEARPWVEASVRRVLGSAHLTLGQLDQSVAQLERAAELRVRELGARDPIALSTELELARAYRDRDERAVAAELTERLVDTWRELGDLARPEAVEALELSGLLAFEGGQADLAEARFLEVLGLWEGLGNRPAALVARKHLAAALSARGELADAEVQLRATLEEQRELLGREHVDALITEVDLAGNLRSQREFEEAEALYREALAAFDEQLPPEHLDRLITGMQLGFLLHLQKRHADVVELVEPLLSTASAALGEDHVLTDSLRIDLASSLAALDRCAEALEVEHRSLESALRVHGPEAGRTLEARGKLEALQARMR